MIATTSVTIVARCDGYACTKSSEATGATLAAARTDLRRQRWAIVRNGYERALCPACARDHAKLVRDGVLSKDGCVRDEAAYDRWLTAHASTVR